MVGHSDGGWPDERWQNGGSDMTNPLDRQETAATIVRHLRSTPLEGILRKPFVDLPVPDP